MRPFVWKKRMSLLIDKSPYLFGGHWDESCKWICILSKCTNSELNYGGFSSYHVQEWVVRWNIIHSCTLLGVSSDADYLFFSLPLELCQTSPAFVFLLSDLPAKSAQKNKHHQYSGQSKWEKAYFIDTHRYDDVSYVYIHTGIYLYMCVCVCVCVYRTQCI